MSLKMSLLCEIFVILQEAYFTQGRIRGLVGNRRAGEAWP